MIFKKPKGNGVELLILSKWRNFQTSYVIILVLDNLGLEGDYLK